MTELAVLAVAVLIVMAAIGIYNRLIVLGRRCDQAGADIDVQMKLRHDLVPSLVETVKGYAGHERGTLEAVIKARAAAVAAPEGPSRVAAEGALGAALGRLMMVAEAYPELKGSQHFANLQSELSDIEHKIAAARRFLNAAATEYNSTREQFPASLVATLFAFEAREIAAVAAEQRAEIQSAPAFRF